MDRCGVCKIEDHRYCCPKCNLLYCSTKCYNNGAHFKCYNNFYQTEIAARLKGKSSDHAHKKAMIEALKKISSSDTDKAESKEDDLWKNLSKDEKNGFLKYVESIQNGTIPFELESYILPWWDIVLNRKAVLDETESSMILSIIPSGQLETPHLAKLNLKSTTTFSLNVLFDLMNVIFSYIHMVQQFDGDHLDYLIESISMFAFLVQKRHDLGNLKDPTDEISRINIIRRTLSEFITVNLTSAYKTTTTTSNSSCMDHNEESQTPAQIIHAVCDILTTSTRIMTENFQGTVLLFKILAEIHSFIQKFLNKAKLDYENKLLKGEMRKCLQKISFLHSWSEFHFSKLSENVQIARGMIKEISDQHLDL